MTCNPHYYFCGIRLGVPGATSRSSDLLGGTHRLSLWSYSWQCFVTAKGGKVKSAKRKGARGKVQRRPSTSFRSSQRSHTECVNSPSIALRQHLRNTI